MSRRNEKYFTGAEWCDNCYLYIFGYGKKRGKQCDFSCIGIPFLADITSALTGR